MHRTGVFTAPTTLVSDDIREILLQNNRLTMEAFHELEPDDFIQLVANEIRCRSKLHYAEIMLDCYGRVESLSFDHVVPSNHKEFLQGIFKRRTYFYKVFEFLNLSNMDQCPPVKGEKGLATIFMSTIDKSYCDQVILEMDLSGAYKGIKNFTDEFIRVAEKHYALGDGACAVPYRLKGFRLVSENSRSRVQPDDSDKHKTHERPSASLRPKNRDWTARKQNAYTREKGVLNFIDQSEDSEGSEREDLTFRAPRRDASHRLSAKGREPDSDDDELSGEEQPAREAHFLDDNSLLEANIPPDRSDLTRVLFMVGNDGETRARGCMYYAIFGNCLKGTKCNNADAHNPEGRARTAAWLMQKLSEAPKPGPNGPVKIMSRDRHGTR